MPHPIYSLQDTNPIYSNDSKIEEQVVKYTNPEIYKNRKKNRQNINNRIASFASVIGGAINFIPHPYAKVVGTALQLPDLYYDVKSNVNNPFSKTNYVHTGLDILNQIKHIIPGNIDDIILQLPGAIDDSYNAITGRDIINDTRRKLVTISENRRSIRDKKNNK